MPATATDRIDGLTTSVAVKAPCQAATTANITLSGLQTVGGVALAAGDRVLVKDQTDTTENGIYVAATSAWSRARDFDGARDVVQGTFVIVVSATGTGSDTLYRVTTANPIVIDSSNIVFTGLTFSDASALSYTASFTGSVARTLRSRLGDIISVKDFGPAANGVTDDTTKIQAALDAVSSTGGIVLIPDGDYLTQSLTPKANTLILLSGGARLIGKTGSGSNCIFNISNNPGTTTNMTTALSGGTQVTVTSSAGFAAGDRIIVSAGTFTGSGVEEGPIEFNTVSSVPDGTHINVATPLRYSYSAFGIPGAAPRVIRLGAVGSIVRNVHIAGGRLCGNASFSGLSFVLTNVENVTIEDMKIEDDPAAGYFCFGTGIMTGHNISNLIFHKNITSGNAKSGAAGSNVGFNVGSMVESKITENTFGVANEGPTNIKQFNHLILEVACRDNIIAHNVFGPIATVNSAAIEFTFYSFGNRIIGNRIWGVDTDIAAGTVTLGIRTFANGSTATFPGNTITGNEFENIMVAIGDAQNYSVISGNRGWNQTLSASAIGIMVGSDAPIYPIVGNTFRNYTYPVRTNTGTEGGRIYDGGTASPTHGASGSIYSKVSSTLPGDGFWTCQPSTTNGTFVWYRSNEMPRLAFASLSTAASNGTLVYVTDGTTGSHPLTGGGGGTMAVRVQNTWCALPYST